MITFIAGISFLVGAYHCKGDTSPFVFSALMLLLFGMPMELVIMFILITI